MKKYTFNDTANDLATAMGISKELLIQKNQELSDIINEIQ